MKLYSICKKKKLIELADYCVILSKRLKEKI